MFPADAADLAQFSLDDDRRLIRNDPAGIINNLAYPPATRWRFAS